MAMLYSPPIAETSIESWPPRAALYRKRTEMRGDAADIGEASRILILLGTMQPSNGKNNEIWIYSIGRNTWREPIGNSPAESLIDTGG